MRKHINHDEEKKLFHEMLKANAPHRMLLIEAPAGYGKSMLLEQFQDIADECKSRYIIVALQTGLGNDPLQVLYKLASGLDDQYFPQFNKLFDRETEINISIQRTVQFGGTILVNTDIDAKNRRAARLAQLSNAWLNDLKTYCPSQHNPIVILIDSYNKQAAGPSTPVISQEVIDWLEGYFLAHLCEMPHLRLVLSGQHLPTENIDWNRRCKRRTLGGIRDINAWHDFCNHHQLNLRDESDIILRTLVTTYHGHPQKIATTLLTDFKNWSYSE
jgi:hypothetical protein